MIVRVVVAVLPHEPVMLVEVEGPERAARQAPTVEHVLVDDPFERVRRQQSEGDSEHPRLQWPPLAGLSGGQVVNLSYQLTIASPSVTRPAALTSAGREVRPFGDVRHVTKIANQRDAFAGPLEQDEVRGYR